MMQHNPMSQNLIRGFIFVGPIGQLACGEYGEGRMYDLNEIQLI